MAQKSLTIASMKDRLSGLWGAQTPMGQFLQDNLITTLFISGVNADQCVFGTFIDAFYKVSSDSFFFLATEPLWTLSIVSYSLEIYMFLACITFL